MCGKWKWKLPRAPVFILSVLLIYISNTCMDKTKFIDCLSVETMIGMDGLHGLVMDGVVWCGVKR